MATSTDIALLTCNQFPNLQKDYQPLLARLKEFGLTAEAMVWNDDRINWQNVKNILFCSVWDYHQNYQNFFQWLKTVSECSNLINSAEIIHWNIDKTYLKHFDSHGIPTIPTIWIEKENELEQITNFQSTEIIVKPSIAAGSTGMKKFNANTDMDAIMVHCKSLLNKSRVMVQPYLPSADQEGETALIYFGGDFCHAIKRPLAGHHAIPDEEVRAASYIEPTRVQSEIGTRILNCLPFKPDYLRVDLLKNPGKEDLVLEVEMIEPSLFFEKYPDSVEIFARSLLERHLSPSKRTSGDTT